MSGRVEGKVVVITGAARGQGAAAARALAAEGAIVIATDVVDLPDVRPGELDQHGDSIVYQQLDVGEPAHWTALTDYLRKQHGTVHGLVNNAGLTHRAQLLDVKVADWDRMLRVNATGPLLGIQAICPLMGAGGSIVTIGSIAAITPHYAVAYTASKWAARGLTKVASLELGPSGIRANIVHPGYIQTAMVAYAPAKFKQANLDATPLGVVGHPDDVANAIVFLISDESKFISGAEIAVDGGLSNQAGLKPIADSVR